MRRLKFLLTLVCAGAGIASLSAQTNNNRIDRETVEEAEKLLGLEFSDKKNDLLVPGLRQQAGLLADIRKFPLANSVPSAMVF